MDKDSIFGSNTDVIYQKKLYRFNLSEKVFLEKNLGKKILSRINKILHSRGVVRFKKTMFHRLNDKYEVTQSLVY